MRLTDQLIAVAEAFASARGISLARLSTLVFNHGARLPRIRAGEADLATGSFEEAMRWFSANWPDGAAWPEEIARPDPSPEMPAQAPAVAL